MSRISNQGIGVVDELRSFLRKREAWFRKFPLHDAHVALFIETYTPTMRAQWQCPACGFHIRRGDCWRDSAGRLSRMHCGCRAGLGRTGYIKHKNIGMNTRTAEFKRLAKIMGVRGWKPVKHQAHVLRWKRWQEESRHARVPREPMSEQERVERRRQRDNRKTAELKDHYIKRRLNKNMPLLKGVTLPQSLIDLERARLMIVREVNQLKEMT